MSTPQNLKLWGTLRSVRSLRHALFSDAIHKIKFGWEVALKNIVHNSCSAFCGNITQHVAVRG